MTQRSSHHDPAARDAAALIDRHDGSAPEIASDAVDEHLNAGDVDAALKMDQVRRQAERQLGEAERGDTA